MISKIKINNQLNLKTRFINNILILISSMSFILRSGKILKYAIFFQSVLFVCLAVNHFKYFRLELGALDLKVNNLEKVVYQFKDSDTNDLTRVVTLKNEKPNVIVFNIKSRPSPAMVYQPIKCTVSHFRNFNTTICVHDLNKDKFVSLEIWNKGVWEPNILSNLKKFETVFLST